MAVVIHGIEIIEYARTSVRRTCTECSPSVAHLSRLCVLVELRVNAWVTLVDVRRNRELWSDSNDSPTPSNASVASDVEAEETVYEDHTNIVRVLQVKTFADASHDFCLCRTS